MHYAFKHRVGVERSARHSKRGPDSIFTFKVRTFWQSKVKISVLALWLCALSSLFHNMGVGGYGRSPLFVRARHVQWCVKKCPHFECVIHRFVLALNAGTNVFECPDRLGCVGGGGVTMAISFHNNLIKWHVLRIFGLRGHNWVLFVNRL